MAATPLARRALTVESRVNITVLISDAETSLEAVALGVDMLHMRGELADGEALATLASRASEALADFGDAFHALQSRSEGGHAS